MKELKYKAITEKIIGASFEVHKFLGNGFTHIFVIIFKGIRECFTIPEVIYQRALAFEMQEAGLSFEREIEQKIYYKNSPQPIGKRRADFVVEKKVLVELKAVAELNDANISQTLNYLKAYKFEVALFINFGGKSLTFKRLVS
jgi:GxxExxY protein